MKKNRWIQIMAISLFIMLIIPGEIVFGKTTVFTLAQEEMKSKSNVPFTLSLQGEDISNLYGFEVVLKFDDSKVELLNNPAVKFTKGFSAGPTKGTEGKYYFGFTKTGKKEGENGDIELAEFKFKAKSEGTYTIKLESVKVVDSNMNTKNFNVNQDVEIAIVDKEKAENFQDIKGHWAERCITEVVNQEYMIGKTEELFYPNDKLTRGEIAMILNNIFEKQEIERDTPKDSKIQFKDINGTEWYAENVLKMADIEVLNGYEDNTFRPNQPITRLETVAIFSRILKEEVEEDHVENERILSAYKDCETIPIWARDSVTWAIKNGIIIGNEKECLNMRDSITRAEISVILCRYLQMENHKYGGSI